MFRLLFLSQGPLGREQMAAEFAKQKASGKLEISCAGDTIQLINPYARRVMSEIDLPIPKKIPTTYDQVEAIPYEIVITICDNSCEKCPEFHCPPACIHWDIKSPIPDNDSTSDEEILNRFHFGSSGVV